MPVFSLFWLIELLKKYPELYNYTLKSYSKRNITDKAWNEVAAEVKLTVNECKEKWKNLRSAFVRHMKPPASGSSSKNKKPYYLTEFMQFALPFIRALSTPVGNLSDCPQQSPTELVQDSADQTQNEIDNNEENEDFQLTHLDNDLSSTDCPAQLPPCPIQIQQDNGSNEKSLSDTCKIPLTLRKRKFQKRANTD
ncbi:MADF domain-containing protein, partial [Aphis craccivora]